MVEPTTTTGAGLSLMALAIAIAGPSFGPYALIVMAALAGALWPLSTMPTTTRSAGALFLLRVVSMAVLLAGGTAYWLETRYQLPAVHTLAFVAFGIGAMGNGWRPVMQGLRTAVLNLVRQVANGGSNGNGNGGPRA